jgi:hypothetical protein
MEAITVAVGAWWAHQSAPSRRPRHQAAHVLCQLRIMAVVTSIALGVAVCGVRVTDAAAAPAKSAPLRMPLPQPPIWSRSRELQAGVSSSAASGVRVRQRTRHSIDSRRQWHRRVPVLRDEPVHGTYHRRPIRRHRRRRCAHQYRYSRLLSTVGGSGKYKNDEEDEFDVTSGGSFHGDGVSVNGTTPIFQSCSPAAPKWIGLLTGGSYALEILYWYDKNTGVNNIS